MNGKINNCGCGSQARLYRYEKEEDNNNYAIISCSGCYNSTRKINVEIRDEFIINEWNKAHPEHNAIASIEEVLAVLEDGKDNRAMRGDLFSQVEDMLLHLKLPEISNAVQAYEWLKQGERITVISDNTIKTFFHVETEDSYSRLEECTLDHRHWGYHSFEILFQNNWELYEELKYKEISCDDALIQYALSGLNKNIRFEHQGSEYYIEELVRDNVNFARIDDHAALNMTRSDLKDTLWRKYEN